MAHGSASGDGCSELGVPFPDGENGTPQSSLQPQPKQLRHHSAAPPQPQLQPQPRPHSYPHSYPELGVPFPVETELFEGHALLRTRSTPGCEEYFAGKARRTSFVVSGRFKRPLSFAQLYTGQEFEQPLHVSRATQLIVRGVLAAVRLVAPLLRVRLAEQGSHALSPLVQVVRGLGSGLGLGLALSP